MIVYLKCLYFKQLQFHRKPDPVISSDDDDFETLPSWKSTPEAKLAE